jgi:hypothetical protein
MDEAFFGRVLRTGAVVTVIVGFMVWGWVSQRAAGSFLAGSLIALAVLESTVAFANVIARPPDERPKRGWPFVVLHVFKYIVVGFLFWLLIARWNAEPMWLAGGLAIPMIVIFLKFAGQAAQKRLPVTKP